MTSYSAGVKSELAAFRVRNECCRRAELTSLLRYGGSVTLRRGGLILSVTLNSLDLAERLISLMRHVYGVKPELSRVTADRLGKQDRFRVRIAGEDAMLPVNELGFFGDPGETEMPKKRCCRDSYIRGAFIACGTMAEPATGYHLELVCEDEGSALPLMRLLNDEGMNAHMTERSGKSIVYIKEAEGVIGFLARAGAHRAVLELENIRILRGIRNDVNRGVNCSTANIKKSTEASMRQIRAIEFLEREGLLRTLPLAVRQTAETRLDNPDASLDELSLLLPGEVTRSGVNHRLRRIMKLAEENGFDPIE